MCKDYLGRINYLGLLLMVIAMPTLSAATISTTMCLDPSERCACQPPQTVKCFVETYNSETGSWDKTFGCTQGPKVGGQPAHENCPSLN